MQHLNLSTVMIYEQFHHFHHRPGMVLTPTEMPPRPFSELLSLIRPYLFWREGQNLLDCYRGDGFDGIDEL